MTNLSVFKDAYDTTPVGRISITDVIEEIRYPNLTEVRKIERIRHITEGSPETYKDEKDTLKRSLRSYTIPAAFKTKRGSKLTCYPSGWTSIDIDELSGQGVDPHELKQQIFDYYPFIYFVFITSSGNGVKAVVKIPIVEDWQDYKLYYAALMEEFSPGVKVDPVTSSIASLTFTSQDPHVFVRSKPSVWDIKNEPETRVISAPPPSFNLDGITEERQFIRNMVVKKFRQLTDQGRHPVLRSLGVAVGGFVQSGYLSRDEAVFMFETLINETSVLDQKDKRIKSAIEFIDHGLTSERPLYINLKK